MVFDSGNIKFDEIFLIDSVVIDEENKEKTNLIFNLA